MSKKLIHYLVFIAFLALIFTSGCTDPTRLVGPAGSSADRTITDSSGRTVIIPSEVSRVVCSSGGTCVRYLVYMDAADKVAAVESGEQYNATAGDNRAYVIANPQFAELPATGSSRGVEVNLEQIMVIAPQMIFAMGSTTNQSSEAFSSADAMQAKTGIPVVMIGSGSFQDDDSKAQLYASFRLLGDILGKEERAEKLIAYTEAILADLDRRTNDIPESEQKTAFIGGLSHGGAHGFMSTQSEYMPFIWNHVKNVAAGSGVQNADFSKESLIYTDPEFIFIDAGTLGVTDEIGGFEDIKSPVFADLSAVRNGNVYATLPYTSRSTNLETQLVDAYYVGKIVYPDRFADIDPKVKADEIYLMFVGEPVFDRLNANCDNLAFEKVPLNRG
ncbi:MAG: Periplasmic binding protein [Methanoregulaceae archaeon PtaB.Bin056]|nr:MAG: Periplasmic binding protein [Methanoregulaceae archaeon PtaB.Bin056]